MRGSQDDDSWRPMAAARSYTAAHRAATLYEEIFFRRKVKFQYAPTSLIFVDDLQRPALNGISWLAVWTTIGLTVALFHAARAHVRTPGLMPAGRFDAWVSSGCVIGLCLGYYPLLKGYTLGQIQVWVTALFAALAWSWSRGWRASSGVCLGMACLIKPALAPLGIWALLRRDWRMAGGTAATLAIGLSLSVWHYGWTAHREYMRVLSFISVRGEAFYPNQSFNGLLNRWVGNGDNLEWQDFEFPSPDPIVATASTTVAAVLLTMALVLPVILRRAGTRADLAVMTLTATIVSPIAWEHHYAILLPILAMVVPALLEALPFGRWTGLLLTIAFVVTGQYVYAAQRLAATPLNPVQSYVLFGALLLLATLYRAMGSAAVARAAQADFR